MRVYDYQCEKCATIFEAWIKNPDILPACKSCGSFEVSRKLSTPSFELNGVGVYSKGVK